MKLLFRTFLGIIVLSLFLISCGKMRSKYPNKPKITYVSKSADTVHFTSSDSLILVFSFQDGGDNLGYRLEDEDSTFFLLDRREGENFFKSRYSFPMPRVPKIDREKGGDLEGSMRIALSPIFHYPRLDSLHITEGIDTMYWNVYMKDNDGNTSDTIKVGPIYIRP